MNKKKKLNQITLFKTENKVYSYSFFNNSLVYITKFFFKLMHWEIILLNTTKLCTKVAMAVGSVYRLWKLNILMRRRPITVAAATPMPAFHHDEFSPDRLAKCFKCLWNVFFLFKNFISLKKSNFLK